MANETNTAEATTPAVKGKGKGGSKKKSDGAITQRKAEFRVVQSAELHPLLVSKSPALAGRSQPVSPEKLLEITVSIMRHGQLQPVQVRETEPGKYEVIFGNTRYDAIMNLFNGFKDGDKEYAPNPEIRLRAEIVQCDDEEAFTHNVVENAQRTQCSAIDNAINQQRLRDEFGMSDAAITRLYGYAHQASVTRLKKLLLLDEEMRKNVHEGLLTEQAGFMLAECDENERGTIFTYASDASKGETSIGATAVKSAIAKRKAELIAAKKAEAAALNGTDGISGTPNGTDGTPGSDATPNGVAPQASPGPRERALTIKELKTLLEDYAGTETTNPACASIVATLLDVANANAPFSAFTDALESAVAR